MTTRSLQAGYGNPRANGGAPPGGVFVLAAEVRPAEQGGTRVDIRHLSRGGIPGQLKR